MSKSAWTIYKVNLSTLKVPYAITCAIFLVLLLQDYIKLTVVASSDREIIISAGNMLWLLLPLAAIFNTTQNLHRFIHLGGKRKSFLMGSLATYMLLSCAVSLACTLVHYVYDPIILSTGRFEGVINLIDVFGWSAHGPLISFVQQWAFLFLLAAFTHTLAALQDSWVGWAVDIALVAIISVFTPIAPLRAAESWFLSLLTLHPSAFVQIVSCTVSAALLYAMSVPVINRKRL